MRTAIPRGHQPKLGVVQEAVRRWAVEGARQRPDLRRLGYFGSYARGDWGVGNLNIVAIVTSSDEPFDRSVSWDLRSLPVPADLLVYTQAEWVALMAHGGRFGRTLSDETIWVYP